MNIFTNNDYRRIQAWLKANAIKDSDFAISENTEPDEDVLVITQNMSTVPTNYKIKIKDLLNSSLSKVVIDEITANIVKVNNALTVDASKVILNKEKGTTLQNILSDLNSAAKNWEIEYQDPAQDEPTVRAKYVLRDYKGVPKGNVIKVYKDSAITNVYLGTTNDTCNPDTGEVTKYPIHDNNDALSIVYRLDTGKYMIVNVPIGIFTREAEFDKYRGLGIESNGQVFIKLASDVESTNYLHFNSLGELAADGIEDRILRDLGNIITSIAGNGTMWGQYKKDEGTKETSTPNDGSRWGEFKRAEEIREQTSDSAHTVFSDNWDEQDDNPEDYDPLAVTEASFAYNWKSVTNPNKTGNIEDLVNKVNALAVGIFYGYYPNENELPQDRTEKGYAYVGTNNPYKIYNFDGTQWKDSGTTIQATSETDEEDITYNEDNKLTFKDRNNTDSMGYVILRKNKSFAEQVTKENTIYEIRYNFIIENNITIPANCVLKFNGGSINSNNSETLAFNNCYIIGDTPGILNVNIPEIDGIIANNKINALWFKPNSDGIDISRALQRADTSLKMKKYIVPESKFGTLSIGCIEIPFGRYSINTPVTLYYGGTIDFNNSYIDSSLNDYILTLVGGSFIIRNVNFKEVNKVFFVNTYNSDFTKLVFENCNFNWCDICIDTNDFENSRSTIMVVDTCYFIQSQKCILSWVDKLNITNCWVYPRPGLDHAMITARGLITISKCIFVPTAGTSNARYIDFVSKNKTNESYVENMGITIENCRFGGEDGSFPVLYNFVDYTASEIQRYTFIDIHDCYITSVNSGNTILILNNLPNLIKLNNIVGVADSQTLIKTSSSFDLTKYSLDKKRIIIGDFVDNGYYVDKTMFVSSELLPITEFVNRNRVDNDKFYKSIQLSTSGYHLIAKSVNTNASFFVSSTLVLSVRDYSNIEDGVGLFKITKVSEDEVYFRYEDFTNIPGQDISDFIKVKIQEGIVYIYAKAPVYNGKIAFGILASCNIEYFDYPKETQPDDSGLQTALKCFISGDSLPQYAKAGTAFYHTVYQRPVWYDKSIYNWRDADGAVWTVKRSGAFVDKPSSSSIYVGFKYFCTDKQTTEGATNGIEIIHKGNDVWVDALGRVIS